MDAGELAVSVIVPTYGRPADLRACLAGLHAQSRPAREVVVVRRAGDEETQQVVAEHELDSLVEVEVDVPGVLAAMHAGIERATGDVIAFSDDDVVPHFDWLARLLGHLADPGVGGVGGRDDTPQSLPPFTDDVGRITRWGKLVGNHHRGAGSARDVDVIKAVGAYRREALALPAVLRGGGAQPHFEVALCLWARRRGWRLVYDPSIVVDHFPAQRFDADRRGTPALSAVRDATYNYVACLLTLERRLFWRRAAFGLLVGDRSSPGLVRAAAALAQGEWQTVRRLPASLTGETQALWDVARGRGVVMVPAARPAAAMPRPPRTG